MSRVLRYSHASRLAFMDFNALALDSPNDFDNIIYLEACYSDASFGTLGRRLERQKLEAQAWKEKCKLSAHRRNQHKPVPL